MRDPGAPGQRQPRVPSAVPLDQQTGESCQWPGGRALAPAGKEHKAAGLRGPAVFAFRPERGPPPPPPPSRPESQGNRKHVLVSSRWLLFSLFTQIWHIYNDAFTVRRTRTAKKSTLPSRSTFTAATGLELDGRKRESEGGGKKKKIKFSSDLIYLNKYKYNFYIKLFTDKQPSQTQKGDLYVLFLLRSPSRRFSTGFSLLFRFGVFFPFFIMSRLSITNAFLFFL